jgi:hypothetical protein
MNGVGIESAEAERFSDHKRRIVAKEEIEETYGKLYEIFYGEHKFDES